MIDRQAWGYVELRPDGEIEILAGYEGGPFQRTYLRSNLLGSAERHLLLWLFAAEHTLEGKEVRL